MSKLRSNPICGKCKKHLQFAKAPVNTSFSSFKDDILSWPGTALVDFWAQWCGACRMIEPVIKELAERKAGILKINKVDVDAEPQLARQFGIRATPTLVLFRNGKKINEISGALLIEQLNSWIDKSLNI